MWLGVTTQLCNSLFFTFVARVLTAAMGLRLQCISVAESQ